MWLRDITETDARHVVENMREWDRREIFATRHGDDNEALIADAVARAPLAWTVGIDDKPIAALGTCLLWPGVWSLWFFATDDLRKIGISVTRLIVRAIIPTIRTDGAHRIECRSMEGHHDAQEWLSVIGATREGTLKRYGRNGEDFHVYTWACG